MPVAYGWQPRYLPVRIVVLRRSASRLLLDSIGFWIVAIEFVEVAGGDYQAKCWYRGRSPWSEGRIQEILF